jgi:spore maturation protein CgeB
MKILYAAMRYDYGIKERGFSFEHYNFYEPLVAMGHDVEYFDFMELHRQHGPVVMTHMLLERVRTLKPDLVVVFLFTDQFDHEVLKRLRSETSVPSVNWFADDHWRFESFTRHWADCFTYAVTTDAASLEKYRNAGLGNAILSQWGVNHHRYMKREMPLQHDVSFVGQSYGDRRSVIDEVRQRGFSVTVRGTHWDLRLYHRILRKMRLMSTDAFNAVVNRTRIGQDEMIGMFCSSRINLNMTASSQTGRRNQIKGRTFEIPGCGGFQLSEYADRIEEFFVPDKEIVTYTSTAEMIDKISYYLDHDTERIAIAEAGHRRALRDHTYEQRFRELFRQMGIA